jgi:hypothetical protein
VVVEVRVAEHRRDFLEKVERHKHCWLLPLVEVEEVVLVLQLEVVVAAVAEQRQMEQMGLLAQEVLAEQASYIH